MRYECGLEKIQAVQQSAAHGDVLGYRTADGP